VNLEAKGGNLLDLSGISLASYVNDKGRCWLNQIKNEKNLWPTRENKQHSIIKSRNQTKQINILILKSLVGDEIQHCEIKQEGVGISGWKSYVEYLLRGLTPWCKLPHIIMGILSKDPK